MARPKLTADKRTIIGRKVKALRREGILPANLYGQGIKSCALQLNYRDFSSVFEKTGESGLIDLVVGKAKTAWPVLVGDIQVDPVTDNALHVDFRQVDLTKKTIVSVPIELVGKAPAVETDEGVLIQTLAEVEVEALPEELPDHIEADTSSLKKVDDAIRVSDLEVKSGVTIKAGQEEVVAKIEPPAKEEEPAPVEEPEVIGEKGEGGEDQEEQPKEDQPEVKPEKAASKEDK
jgi:large subunit ribosomal protein L25